MPDLFGHKSTSLLDLWTIVHFLTGCASPIAIAFLSRLSSYPRSHPVSTILLISLTWEILEFYMETGAVGPSSVRVWFDGVEHFSNRIISDQVALLLGYFLCAKRHLWAIIAKILATTWLAIHIFIFPHSMYLQEVWSQV